MAQQRPRVRELDRRILHEGSVGSFGLYDLELPTGHRFTLELLRHPGAAAVVPFLDSKRILLIRQYRFATDQIIWEIPAGKRDPGESPQDCAARELEEETGYCAGRLERTGEILTTPGFTDECIHLFCAYDLKPGNVAREPSEWIELHEVELAQALAMVNQGEITDSKTVVALYHAARRSGLLG
jgi:ADP-ribose pyrophosphatase